MSTCACIANGANMAISNMMSKNLLFIFFFFLVKMLIYNELIIVLHTKYALFAVQK